MFTARLITTEEIDLVETLFDNNRSVLKKDLEPTDMSGLIQSLKDTHSKGISHISMTFDDANVPYGVYVGYEVPRVQGWVFGMSKVRSHKHHYRTTAEAVSKSFDLLIEHMENKGLYKWWTTNPERYLRRRPKIMREFSKYLDRYDYYDELVIPSGQLANIALFDAFRPIVDWSDILVRMYVLKQRHRVQFLRKQHASYIGETLE
jgi:hypothetical protein